MQDFEMLKKIINANPGVQSELRLSDEEISYLQT
jgi:hypothetical protein